MIKPGKRVPLALLSAISFVCLVAPRAPAQPIDMPSAQPSVADTSDPLRRARDAMIVAGDPSAALEPAEQIVEQPDAARHPAHAADLVRLGDIHTALDDFDSAERRYFEAIDVVRAASGEFSIDLIEPYHALGRSYIASRRLPEAITAIEQAQHIAQRNLGLFNVEQAELIDDLTTAYLGLGDTATAGRLQRERLDNAIRRFGELDARVVPYRYGLASYYEQSRLRNAAREQYERALAALEAAPEASREALLFPLRRLLRIDLLLGDRDVARERIAEILAAEPDLAPAERAQALAALGDWSAARDGNLSEARSRWAAAHEALAELANERRELFGRPEMLDFIAPLTSVDRGARSRPWAWGTIVLAFDVGADGRASAVRVVSSEPSGIVDDAYVRRIREAHFRPRIVGGDPVETAGVRYTHYFRYYAD
jgi:TonB family protein